MMNLRKNPEKDLRRFSGLFFQIGLLCSLLLTVSAFEWSTPKETPQVAVTDNRIGDETDLPPVVEWEEEKPKPRKNITITVSDPEVEEIPVDDFLDDWSADIDTETVPLPPLKDEPVDEAKDYVDTMPTPVGGYEAFYQYVAKNVQYTRQAQRLNLQGKVYVQFVVDKDGSVTEVKIARGLGAGLDEEALQVMENAPKWNPGRQSGRRVKVRMMIPIYFRLQ